jgi:hypothetical protein
MPVSVNTEDVSADTDLVSTDTGIRIHGYADWPCIANFTGEKRIDGYA